MISFFANIFGYILNLLYQVVNNYGFAIILFSVILKLIMLPISIKQQKTMKKSAKIQESIRKGKLLEDLFYQKDKYPKKNSMMNAANVSLTTCKMM